MTNDDIQLSPQDQADLDLLAAVDEPLEMTVLEVWREVLSNIEEQAAARIEPGYATQIIRRWPTLTYKDIFVYYATFHDYLIVYRDILTEQLRLHPDALKAVGHDPGDEDSDAVANRDIYKEIMFEWNLVTAKLENAWDVSDPNAAAQIAAMAEAQAFVTGGTGIMQALVQPQVGFQWNDEDQQELETRINEAVASSL